MVNLIVGVGKVTIYLRHAQSLKDKRNVLKSLKERLKNLGFSVSECAYQDNPKRGALGFACVSGETSQVGHALYEAFRLFLGDYEVLDTQREIFDYSGEDGISFEAAEG